MYIKVKKWENDKVKGRAYTYVTDMDLAVGDLVVAEFGEKDSVLCVTDLDVEKPTEFECKAIKRSALTEDFVSPKSGIQIKIITETMPEIKINYDDLKHYLVDSLKKYKGIVVTEDNLKDCKSMRKELTRLKKDVDSYRISKKKEFSAPIKVFEEQCKTLVELIEEVELPIKEGTDHYDEKVKNKNLEFAAKAVDETVKKHNLNRFYAPELVIKAEYGNLVMTQKKILNDIEQSAQVLDIEQQHYESRLNAVNSLIEDENKSLTHKLDLKDYELACYEKMDSSAVIALVKEDAAKIRAIEDDAKKQLQLAVEKKAGVAESEMRANIAAAVEEYIDNTPDGPLDGQIGFNDFTAESNQVPIAEPIDANINYAEIAFADLSISGDPTKVDMAISFLQSIDGLDVEINGRGKF